MCKRTIVSLCCVLAAGLAAQAGTFTLVDLPATGTDAAIGISTSKTYTHTFDFGSNAPVTINDVVFERGPTASLTATYTHTSRQGYGYTLSETRATINLPVHAGNDPSAQADGDSAGLLQDMIYQATPNAGDAERLTLSNLLPGTTYSTRFYYRTWTLPSDPSRVINVSADGETHGTFSDTFRLSEDAGGSHYLDYTFTADDADVTFQFAATVYNYSMHIYGFTNEVIRAARCATYPRPADKASDVLRDTVLTWKTGLFAATHDVYLGTVLDDVKNASRANPLGVQVSRGQDANTCDPGRLEFGTTYYWRVDEVNAPPDATVVKGFVWSFTVEPRGYAVTNIKATASSSLDADSGPENTIDGSGLNASGQHSIEPNDMWLSAGKPAWIQYEFDRLQKLDQMLVWNSNQSSEAMFGLGARSVTIEYATDGNDWKTLGDFEVARATGKPTYAGGAPVEFGGAVAKYVKLTIHSNWGGFVDQCGLSEVRFLAVPMRARQPGPANGATGVAPLTSLSWRYGRQAAMHEVYLGTNANDLALVATVAEPSCELSIDLGKTYYWKVVEVNEAELPSTWESDIWSFTTRPYLVVDDFESYNNEENQGTRIYETWIDGWDNPAANGAIVGYGDTPFAERARTHNGLQSMPLTYNNAQAPLSVAERTFDEPQDWTQHNIQSLSLYLSGVADNKAGQLYVRINNGAKLYYQGAADDFKQPAWAPFNIDLAAAGTNLTNVTKLAIGVEGAGATGKLLIDDIRLYPKPVEFVTPVTPSTDGLLAYYKLDGDGKDSAGSHHGTLTNLPTFVPGQTGQALNVTLDQYINVPYTADLSLNTFSVAVWVNPSDLGGNRGIIGTRFNGDNTFDVKVSATLIHGDIGNGTAWLSTVVDVPAALSVGEWYHLAYVFDDAADTAELYVNGILARTMVITGTPLFMKSGQDLRIGADYPTEPFRGLIDEVRLYNRPLSMAEVAALAARTAPVYKPF